MLISEYDLLFIGGPTITFAIFILYQYLSGTKKKDVKLVTYPFIATASFVIWPLLLFTLLLLFVQDGLRNKRAKNNKN